MLHALRAWPQLRATMQAAAVRRQVARTQAAALCAQLAYPPPLPPAPPAGSEGAAAAELALPPVLPSNVAVLDAHRRMLREAQLQCELEEAQEAGAADGEGGGGGAADGAAGAPPATPRSQRRELLFAAARAEGTPLSPSTLERGALALGGAAHPGVGQLSPAELVWLANLERPSPTPPPLAAPAPA